MLFLRHFPAVRPCRGLPVFHRLAPSVSVKKQDRDLLPTAPGMTASQLLQQWHHFRCRLTFLFNGADIPLDSGDRSADPCNPQKKRNPCDSKSHFNSQKPFRRVAELLLSHCHVFSIIESAKKIILCRKRRFVKKPASAGSCISPFTSLHQHVEIDPDAGGTAAFV